MRVLVAGGGVAALEAILALRALAGERVTVELLAPAAGFALKPESVRAPFGGAPATEVTLAPALHRRGALAGVDSDAREAITTDGGRIGYDRLIVATGAHAVDVVHGATPFHGSVSAGAVEAALRHERVVLTAPDVTWTLPIYELALLAGRQDLTIVTPEPRPLDVFGEAAVARLLDERGIAFIGDTTPAAALDGALLARDGRLIPAGAVIALPRLQARPIAGLPDGFLAIDDHARVIGVPGVYAAGDVTDGPVKQGGLATQQADAAAEHIAAEAGAGIVPQPYVPVLRGLLLTGGEPLRLGAGVKVAGRYLTPYLEGATA